MSPVFSKPEIIADSQYERFGSTDIDKLETDIRDISAYIDTRTAIYRDKIKAVE
jgi:hypothetical protein